jgi:hypothetical protein
VCPQKRCRPCRRGQGSARPTAGANGSSAARTSPNLQGLQGLGFPSAAAGDSNRSNRERSGRRDEAAGRGGGVAAERGGQGGVLGARDGASGRSLSISSDTGSSSRENGGGGRGVPGGGRALLPLRIPRKKTPPLDTGVGGVTLGGVGGVGGQGDVRSISGVGADVRSAGVQAGGGAPIRGRSEGEERRDRVAVCVQRHDSEDDEIVIVSS